MASKINPKGVFKSNLKSKSPNPKGINPKGVYKAPAKPRVNPKGINPTGIGPNKDGINPGGIKKPVSSPASKNSTVVSGSSNKNNKPVRSGSKPIKVDKKPVRTGNKPTTTSSKVSAPKTNTTVKVETLSSKPANRTNKPVREGKKPVRTGNKPVREGSKKVKAAIIADKNAGTTVQKFSKRMTLAELESAAAKRYKPLGPDNLSKTSKTVTGGANKLLKNTADKAKANGMDLPKSGRKNVTAPKAIYKPDFKSFKKVGKRALIATAAALLAKGVYDKVSEKNKATALAKTKDDAAKKAKEDAAKKAKADAAKNQAAKSQALKNELAKKEAAKKDTVKKYAGVKDKWGRSASDKWFGFDPKTKSFTTVELPKKTEVKKSTNTVKPKTVTPKVEETSKVAETPKVDDTKNNNNSSSTVVKDVISSDGSNSSTSAINSNAGASKNESTKGAETKTSEEKKPEVIQVAAKRTPKGGLINKIRGAVNESRERRVGRALGRGDSERAAELEAKIKRTESKMYMKKGGVVKKTKPKKK